MEHYRLRKHRGPETWARVREAYLAGETAASVARRFDVGVSNLRRRAVAEGWTRNRLAEQLDRALTGEEAKSRVEGGAVPVTPPRPVVEVEMEPPLPPHLAADPGMAVVRAMRHAARLLSAGRTSEAALTLRTAERLSALEDVVYRRSRGAAGPDSIKPRASPQ